MTTLVALASPMLKSLLHGFARSAAGSVPRPRRYRPIVEILEDRLAPAATVQFSAPSETVNAPGPFSIPVTLSGTVPAAGTLSTFASGVILPVDLAFDAAGNLFVSRQGSNTVSEVTPAGVVSTFASGFSDPLALAFDTAGNLYVANASANTVSKVTPAGVVSTFTSGISTPDGLAFDAAGNLYVANRVNGTVSELTPAGVVSTFASGFSTPTALAFDTAGNLYVVNSGSDKVSKVTPAGVVSIFASGFNQPHGLAFDAAGNLYVSNSGTDKVSEVTPAGVVSTFASGLNQPLRLAFDAAGNLYVSSQGNNTVSEVSSGAVAVPFTLGGTALSGTDDTGVSASPLILAPGQSSATITGTLLADPGASPTLTFTLGTPTAGASLGSPSINTLTITEVPTVTSISPTFGPAAGGTSVSITGTDFTAASTVKFGGTAASVTYNSPTSLTATSPGGVGVVDITVTTTSGTSATSAADQFSYVPSVTSISPSSGSLAGGTSVTITGTGFTAASRVDFGAAAAASVTFNSSTSLNATSPAGSGTLDVTVTTAGITSATSAADQFTFQAATSTAITSAPAVTYNAHGMVTVTVSNTSGSTAVPVGVVKLTINGTNHTYMLTATDADVHTFDVGLLDANTWSLSASFAGSTNFAASGPASGTLTVNQAAPTFSGLTSPTITYGAATALLSGTITAGSLIPPGNVSITVNGNTQTAAINSSTGACSLAFPTATLGVAGSPYTITYAYAGATDFQVVTDTNEILTVTPASQSITFGPLSPVMFGVGPITLSASGGASGNPVTFSIDPSSTGAGTISSGVLTVTGGGNIVIDANQAGNANYTAAPQVQQTLIVNPASQTITFGPLSPVTYGVGPITLSASSNSGLPISFNVVSGPGSISGNTLTTTGTGSIVVQAGQAGNADYTAALAVQQTLVVNPVISLGPLSPSQGMVAQAFTGTVAISGGTGTYTNQIVTGLPAGLSAALSGNTITVSGTPTASGPFSLTVTVQDSSGATGTTTAPLTISALPTPTPIPPIVRTQLIALGADAGGGPQVDVYNAATGALVSSFYAFSPSFSGGVRVAVDDVNGDGIQDIICAAGPGTASQVVVIDGTQLNQVQSNGEIASSAVLASSFAFAPTFSGGVYVAAGMLSSGQNWIVCGAGSGGGPQVVVFTTKAVLAAGTTSTPTPLTSFYAFLPGFSGGVTVAVGDVLGTGRLDLIAGAGAGGGPQVIVVDGTKFSSIPSTGILPKGALLASFYAFTPSFGGGVFVSGGVTSGNQFNLLIGQGTGASPQALVVNGAQLGQVQTSGQIAGSAILDTISAFPSAFSSGGVRVGFSAAYGSSGTPTILSSPGPAGQPKVAPFDGATFTALSNFFALAESFSGGIFIAG